LVEVDPNISTNTLSQALSLFYGYDNDDINLR